MPTAAGIIVCHLLFRLLRVNQALSLPAIFHAGGHRRECAGAGREAKEDGGDEECKPGSEGHGIASRKTGVLFHDPPNGRTDSIVVGST